MTRNRTKPDPILDVDRIALSNELYELSERFAMEAVLWTPQAAHDECVRVARTLAQIARGVISGAADFRKAEAFRDAARMLSEYVVGARRLFDGLSHLPNVERKDDQ
ncbi:hypothetical protein [uncultured Microbacterium sp.]|uniref:hypothetical protein n=1 Tax=uncultured Microbacterium sp. TaxID=191216 RepID=UPI0026309966|nr:hypothetical protein [uncultured Microbacterium sp.]